MAFRFLPLFVVIWAAGCSPRSTESGAPDRATSEYIDDEGRSVLLAAHIDRIVPLAPNITEIVFAAGAGRRVAAVSQADDFPPAVSALPRFSSFPMDYEALVSYSPDVLIGASQVNNPADAHLMESLGMPVYYFSFSGWADVVRAIRRIGDLAGTSEQAEATADSLDAAMRSIASRRTAGSVPDVLFLIGADQLFSSGKSSYIHDIIARAGGASLTADMDSHSPILSEEFVLTSAPEIIVGTFSDGSRLLERHPVFASVPAVANGRICTVEPSWLLRPGPRLVDGARAIADCLHLQPAGDSNP